MKKTLLAGLLATISMSALAEVPMPDIKESMTEFMASRPIPSLDKSKSLLGPDKDKNHIRDDIDQYLNSRQFTPEQLDYLKRVAVIYQLISGYGTEPGPDAVQITHRYAQTTSCSGVFEGFDQEKEGQYLFAFTFNTDQRIGAYRKFSEDERTINATYSVQCKK